ncbi:MAG: YiiX family permuted papain-like enzyme [Flavobacterium sp.]
MRYFFMLIFLGLFSCKRESIADAIALKNGDLIFQTSKSAQSKAIQLATKSKYSHCGIIYKDGDNYFVFEAIQPVTTTPLQDWIDRGEGSHYVVKRLKDSTALTQEKLTRMKKAGKEMTGKDYDLYFEWSDDRIYCSELIWKIYKDGAGIEVVSLQQLRDFDLSHPEVQKIMKKRYGNTIPLNEKVVSPAAIFESDKLYTVSSD